MIVASMSITPERQEVIDFTKKYYQTPAIFAAPADADFTDSPEDMAGKMVGVQRGTIHQAFMEKNYPDTELTLYASQDEAYLDLTSGRLDAVMGDSIAITDGFLETEQGEGYAQLGEPHVDPAVHGNGAGIGVRKEDTELRDRLTAAIEAIRANGTYDEIAGKYFDFDIYGGTS
jgi:polar amino acid transport system substrate-binding protein/arginine/ornithine transport system substrate-binding protein